MTAQTNLAVVQDHDELQNKVDYWPEKAEALVVTSPESFAVAATMLTGIKKLRKEVKDTLEPVVKKAHEAHKAACGVRNEMDAPLIKAEKIIKRTMGVYQDEQERIRAEEQRRLEAEALKREEERRLADAAALEDAGQQEAAEQLIEQPVNIPVVVAPAPVPKAKGVSFRKTWKATVTDKKAALDYILRNYQFLGHLVDINPAALNHIAKQQKEAFEMPGVKVYTENNIAAGSR